MKATIKNTVTKEYWLKRHEAALYAPKGSEVAIIVLLGGLETYALESSRRSGGFVLAQDYVLGEAWKDAVLAVRALLNGDCGRLDCGTLDKVICKLLTDNGFDTEGNAQ